MLAPKCCPGVCLCLTSVVSASVRRPTLTRSTPFTSCVCHPSVAASRCRVVVDSALLTVLTILFGTGCSLMTGKYFFNYFQYQEFVGCVCMLNYWFSSNDTICADNYIFSRFKLKGKCRSEKWELYLYGDMTIKVDRDIVEVLPRGVPPPRFFTQLGNGSHTIYELCLPFVRGMDEHASGSSSLEWEIQRDVRVHGSSCGTRHDVLHSHYDRKHLRCHCSSRVHVLCFGRLQCLCDSNVQRGCLRRFVV